ncbi:flavin-dependent dehydrogenase [Frankia casuarinae]|uniref:Tryptophan halogenase n=1 Tax=Frankia casuarinae (strain DSM 45818 / CECT 9043 / HFP020203 / CcI3) TaxID=106370 RepID=Q2J9C6_FRACC|nr:MULTISPECIES: tryptophan 7-halogenase [Frankia]ABD12116.1 tryptophan halogenase [Frankia casuarinae]ETA00526.1 flavin-dependent dehydrogenase [Frankia sp. CcI6]EYT91841.1 flavin-dependent dehydrogenase [Frankia casuarinae]KEZ34833.1 flavin-dependent dehydrogenase [Frankia sp. CeD]OAA21177.1 flavin-dependent dehydrogenase [Frankia casuarinae]
MRDHYDVIIAGGGPAGSTLAALLARTSDLKVAIFEKDEFPREHIGESFAHPLIPVLAESGALAKVLASNCWVKKFGGIYSWARQGPSRAFFDHANWAVDGVHRWALHVNRSEFDQILLEHARDLGVDVTTGMAVTDFAAAANGCQVTLADGTAVSGAYFVDASGRQQSLVTKKPREWLSGYRNIAIWQHYLGGLPAQGLDGDWNIFREKNLSPIGCFAFPDGWCWYIPVPRIVNGERVLTHSIGIVTSPEVLKEPGKDFTDSEVFLRTVRGVPRLADLVAEVTPISDQMMTVTNYSRVNERFADLDRHWILIGDASYFVDPLFSSGVAFAANQAASAALLLRTTLRAELSPGLVRDLWQDYDHEWHGMAEVFALSIDQWYHMIGADNPGSAYWHRRNSSPHLDMPDRSFDALLNTAFTPDLLLIMTRGTGRMSDLAIDGPYQQARAHVMLTEPEPDAVLVAAPGVRMRAGVALDVPGFKAVLPPADLELDTPAAVRAAVAEYWTDPVAAEANGGLGVPSPTASPVPCHRFEFDSDALVDSGSGATGFSVRGVDSHDGAPQLWEILSRGPVVYGELGSRLAPGQRVLLQRLIKAGMVTVKTAARQTTPGTEAAEVTLAD